MSVNSALILAALFFLIGAAIMGLIWYLQNIASGNYRKGKQVKPDPNIAEVASLMRDKTTQELVVTMNGDTFRAAKELNPGQLRRLHFASKVLVKWLADTPSAPLPETLTTNAPVETVKSEPLPETDTPADPSGLPEEWIPVESIPDNQKPEYPPAFITPEPPPKLKPVSTQLSDVVGNILNPAPPAQTAPEFKSIAMQIDEILQEIMVNTPFAQRGISVNDAPDHGVMVTLDGNKYPGVKDVPDEEVRNLIRSAVVEWEKTSKSGSRNS